MRGLVGFSITLAAAFAKGRIERKLSLRRTFGILPTHVVTHAATNRGTSCHLDYINTELHANRMTYYLRQKDSDQFQGPLTLEEIRERIPDSIDVANTLVAPAKGQSLEALRTYTRWDPLALVLEFDRSADHTPIPPPLAATGPSLYEKQQARVRDLSRAATHALIGYLTLDLLLKFFAFGNMPRGASLGSAQILAALAWAAVVGVIGTYVILALKYITLAVLDMAENQGAGE
jgi:hypothetical protein